jgi:mannosyl-3-phosphoglycerate phosphatase
MIMHRRFVIFSDLDGTLLDHDTYSFEPALPALRLLKEQKIPLIISTSKSRGEIEKLRSLLGNNDPFISENGGGIFIPERYFAHRFPYDDKLNGYYVIEPGSPRETLRGVLKSVTEETGINIKGISDMSVSEIMESTGLDRESAKLAGERNYSEPFLIHGYEVEIEAVIKKIEEKGYGHTRGSRFHHILGNNDKGKAIKIVTGMYKKESPFVKTIGLGDSPNDLPMLKAVDFPVQVRKKGGLYESGLELANIILADGEGPTGWNSAILKFFLNYEEITITQNRN